MVKLVQLEGEYATQSGWMFKKYLDLYSRRVFWWSRQSEYFKSCLGSKEHCMGIYNLRFSKIKTVK